MKRFGRAACVLAVLALLATPVHAPAATPTCEPFADPGQPNACGSVSCVIDDVHYAANCSDVDRGGSSAAATGKVLMVLALIGLFWIVPVVMLRRAAERRGLNKDELVGAWFVFGWLGVTYHLMKAIPHTDSHPTPQPPPPKEIDTVKMFERVAHNMAARRQQRDSN